MGKETIWFDGVDKRLIEAHCEKKEIVKGDDKNLMTKTPLAQLKSLDKKRTMNGLTSQKVYKKSTVVNGGQTGRDTLKPSTRVTDELAIDCEMVECYGNTSVLARVSIVNLFGHPLLDQYVAPPAPVTDYRTRYSGIRRSDLEGAPDFDSVQKEVASLIKNKILVGHSLHNDFRVLKLRHPQHLVRDTSKYYKGFFGNKTPSLKRLCEKILGIEVQNGEHDSIQDAQATMRLYVKERERWDKTFAKLNNNIQSSKRLKQSKKPAKKKSKTFYVTT